MGRLSDDIGGTDKTNGIGDGRTGREGDGRTRRTGRDGTDVERKTDMIDVVEQCGRLGEWVGGPLVPEFGRVHVPFPTPLHES